jgi:hypothetical protein
VFAGNGYLFLEFGYVEFVVVVLLVPMLACCLGLLLSLAPVCCYVVSN